MKTEAEYFRDWESHVFGYGYGTGEAYVIPVLKTFLEHCNEGYYKHSYQYDVLEKAVTAPVAWLLINTLCHADIIEYGTSPRYAWLTPKGERLRDFMANQSNDALYEIAANYDTDYVQCSPAYCNCDEEKCSNPFW